MSKRQAGGQLNNFCHFIEVKFNLREIVYLRTDKEQLPRLVTALYITDEIQYELGSGIIKTIHADYEISREQNIDLIEYENEFEEDLDDDDDDDGEKIPA